MTAIMGLVVRHLKARERVSFVFDRGHQGQGKAEQLFYWVLDADPVVAPRIVRSFQTADSIDFPPLQAAGQLVWGCNRGTRLDLPVKRGFIEMRGIPKLRTPVFGGTYAGESLEKTVANIGAGGPLWGPYTKGVRKKSPGPPTNSARVEKA